jgi:cytochrome c551/c552
MNFGESKATRYLVVAALLAAEQSLAADELDLAIKSGCISCHRGAAKLIGPPYAEVAAKYAGRKDGLTILTNRILQGTGPDGQGWMQAGKAALPFMPPNAIKPKEAERLAAWVLGMKGEIPGLMEFVTQRLSVTGAVEHPLDLSLEELRTLPASDVKEIALDSQSPAKAGKIEVFRGVLLRTLLEKAKVAAPGRHDLKKTVFVAKASDDYAVVFTWSEIFNTEVGDGVLVVFEKDGKPLAEDEGRIALISAKDIHRGARHVRWLKAIEVRKAAD